MVIDRHGFSPVVFGSITLAGPDIILIRLNFTNSLGSLTIMQTGGG
jgi:hypothetical protein